MKKTVRDAEIDLAAIKAINEKKIWTSFCKVCNKAINGTLTEIRNHTVECHGEAGK